MTKRTVKEIFEDALLGAGTQLDGIDESVADLFRDLDAAGFVIVPKHETEIQIRVGKIAAEYLVDGSADQGGPRVWSLESRQLSAIYRAMITVASQPEMTERELREWFNSLPTSE